MKALVAIVAIGLSAMPVARADSTCTLKVAKSQRAICAQAERAANRLERARYFYDEHLDFGDGDTLPLLRMIARLGVDGLPIWTRLAHSTNPVARAAAAMALKTIAQEPWAARLLKPLKADSTKVEFWTAEGPDPQTVAWFVAGAPTWRFDNLDRLEFPTINFVMNAQKTAVSGCANPPHPAGVGYVPRAAAYAVVRFTVAPTRAISEAHVEGVLANTPVATCIEAVIRAVKFPCPIARPQTISYSFSLR